MAALTTPGSWGGIERMRDLMTLRRGRVNLASEGASLLREIACHLRAGYTPRDALRRALDGARGSGRARAALELGAPLALVCSRLDRLPEEERASLVTLVELHRRVGGDLAAMLEHLARRAERRGSRERMANAHVAGARLSARMIAALPVIPVAGALLDGSHPSGPGAALVLAGAALGGYGFRWMSRLFPRPPRTNPRAEAVTLALAAASRSGVASPAVLTLMASTSADEELLAAGRLVRLGLRWSEALERSAVAGLARLGGVMRRAETLGAPLADQLEHLLEQDEEAASRMYEEAVRRAPVRMVLPLTLCVLPAFVLLSVGPFLGQVGAAS